MPNSVRRLFLGLVLLAAAALAATASTAAVLAAAALADTASAADARPDDGACEVFVDKTAQPTNVLVGETVELTLSVDGRCPQVPGQGEADVVLAIDRSASQRDNGTWTPTIDAATLFVELIDFSRHKVGVFTFSGRLTPLEPDTVMRQPLTSDAEAVRSAIAAIPEPLPFSWDTNLTAAVDSGHTELTSNRHRPEAEAILVLLSDGDHTADTSRAPIAAADEAKAAGTTIITIGLAVDDSAAQTLRQMASRPELYFPAPTGEDLTQVMREIVGQVATGRITDLEVTDQLPPEVEYVSGSASPVPDSIVANVLTWSVPVLDATGWRARYFIRPLVAGTYSTNKLAVAEYTDADGSAGLATFPQPLITVREPEPIRIYLPVLMRRYCQPGQPFDVVMAVDTSSSMWGEKLVRTRQAAREFLELLQMPPSQAAVLAFNAEANMVQPLTPNRSAAMGALDALPLAEGSRIDLALTSATAELTGARHARDHTPVLILLTDGRQAGAPRSEAVGAAQNARDAGITIYTIGIGSDVDPDLLRTIAGDPQRYYPAPSTEDLIRIYRDIAGVLPCIQEP